MESLLFLRRGYIKAKEWNKKGNAGFVLSLVTTIWAF